VGKKGYNGGDVINKPLKLQEDRGRGRGVAEGAPPPVRVWTGKNVKKNKNFGEREEQT